MRKQTVLAKKRRGPAPTGKGVQVVVRIQPSPLSALDEWAAKQEDQPTRAEAIRRLVELGLTVKPSVKPTNKAERSSRARDLATKAVDNLSDPAANPEERNQRRKSLVKGPSEFREVRVDLPKRKT